LGEAHFKKLRRAEGGAKMFGVFRVKNHDFTPKKLIFSIAKGGAKIFEVFRVKVGVISDLVLCFLSAKVGVKHQTSNTYFFLFHNLLIFICTSNEYFTSNLYVFA
jgi:hypothetical protein